MPNKELILIFFGSILGFGFSQLAEYARRHFDRIEQRKSSFQMLLAVINEVEEGISRCEGLVEKLKNNKVSFSRVYVSLWDSVNSELSKNINDLEILILLHKIYYRFDLVNFNMNREDFGAGSGFAKEYLSEMKANLITLKERIKNKNT